MDTEQEFLADVRKCAEDICSTLDKKYNLGKFRVDNYRVNCKILGDDKQLAKEKIAFSILWPLLKFGGVYARNAVKSFLMEKFSSQGKKIYSKCAQAAIHSIMLEFAREIYSIMGKNVTAIINKHSFPSYNTNCNIRPNDSFTDIVMKMATDIFKNAFIDRNCDIEQRIILFLSRFFGPRLAVRVYDKCMMWAQRGRLTTDIKNGKVMIAISVDTGDELPIEIMCEDI